MVLIIHFPDISYLNCESDQLGIHLYDIENWILSHTHLNHKDYNELSSSYDKYMKREIQRKPIWKTKLSFS